jgi:hypothetical protein
MGCLRQRVLITTALVGVAVASYPISAHALDSNAARLYAQTPWGAPAVDGLNSRWDGLGGSLNSRSLYEGRGFVALPLGGQLGLQFDGTAGSLDSKAFYSGGGHLFWRNPYSGLLGLYGNYIQWNQFGDVNVAHVAAEGEAYWGRWTLQGIIGAEFGNSASNVIQAVTITPPTIGIPGSIVTTTFIESYDVKTRFMDQVNLKYYFTDNWDGYIGHRYLAGRNALALGSEMAMPLGRGVMASAFVEGRVGSSNFEGIWGGLRIYFGQKDKTLIRREREDNAPAWDKLFSLIGNARQNTTQSIQGLPGLAAPLTPPPPPLPPPPIE